MRISEKIGRLFDYAVEHANGFTYLDVEADLHWRRTEFFKVVNRLRAMMGNDDQINLVCEPGESGKPWIYKLVGNIDGAKLWNGNRIGDCESRIMTMHAVLSSIVSGSDGRTVEGRRARIMHRTLGRLIEDLAELDHSHP